MSKDWYHFSLAFLYFLFLVDGCGERFSVKGCQLSSQHDLGLVESEKKNCQIAKICIEYTKSWKDLHLTLYFIEESMNSILIRYWILEYLCKRIFKIKKLIYIIRYDILLTYYIDNDDKWWYLIKKTSKICTSFF